MSAVSIIATAAAVSAVSVAIGLCALANTKYVASVDIATVAASAVSTSIVLSALANTVIIADCLDSPRRPRAPR